MAAFLSFLQTTPGKTLTGIALLLLAVGAVLLFRLIGILRFRRRLRKSLENEAELMRLKARYSERFLRNQSPVIEAFAAAGRPDLPRLLSLDEVWLRDLKKKDSPVTLKRVLAYCPDRGLFTAFSQALGNPRSASILKDWLEKTGDFLVLRRIPLSSPGSSFDSRKGYELLQDRLDEVREMSGDPEWPPRYFALTLLQEDEDERARRIIREALDDSHPLIRRLAVQTVKEEDVEGSLYEILFNLIKTDPVYEVRREARERIMQDFSGDYQVTFENLHESEAIHFLELLDSDSQEDENRAIEFLRGDNMEFRFLAARFLQNRGSLKKLFLQADMGDEEMLERNYELLAHSCSVQIDGFLAGLKETDNPGSLLIAARLLPHYGDRKLITSLARNVLSLAARNLQEKGFQEIYNFTITAVVDRGTDEALAVLNQELERRPEDKDFLELLMPALPRRGDALFLPTLMGFLKNPDFPAREVLEQTLSSLPDSMILPDIMKIIHGGRDTYSHTVRISALRVLGKMEHPYCLQTILENLPTLPLDEARRFAELLQNYKGEIFEERAARLLSGRDAHVRASLIAALPGTGKKSFLKEIKASLEDADPEVRIAALWALTDYKEIKNADQTAEMLRDPVERVREEAARALGRQGSAKNLKSLEQVLKDENEVIPVKNAALQGLAASSEKKALEILAGHLAEADEQREDPILRAMAEKQDKKSMEFLIENFKDADTKLRRRYARLFRMMGEGGEEEMVALLRQDLPSLRPFIAEILEETGFIEAQIRKLNNREVKARRDAAEILALMESASAFRGIVMAARDPDQEVRVKVTKALERLDSEEGKEILHQLEEDPDKRIRKYTLWALERYRARRL